MSTSKFSSYIRERVKALGMNMSGLAEQTGISRQALYGLLDGTTGEAKISTLIALACALKVHPVVLFRQLLNTFELPKFSTHAAKYQFDSSGFVAETLPDNSMVTTGQVFSKSWQIQNIGHMTWKNRKLVCVDEPPVSSVLIGSIDAPIASRLLLPTLRSIQIPETLPGDTVELHVEFTAPRYPCTVMSYWKMVDEAGDICFPATEGLSCLVRVVAL